MTHGGLERRRGRRASVEASLRIRRMDASRARDFKDEAVRNVSLAGVYFETPQGGEYVVNDVVMTSVSIPEPHTRLFPFTRLSGRGRVVRVNELPPQGSEGRRFGVALEFMDDLTALSAIPRTG